MKRIPLCAVSHIPQAADLVFSTAVKYTIYEDPTTHQFAHRPLPSRYLAGDPLPAVVIDRWFESHDTAVAALAELLDRDEAEDTATADAAPTDTAGAQSMDPAQRRVLWFRH